MYDNISIIGAIVPIGGFYNGDRIDGDRALTDEEKALLCRGYGYKIINHQVIDVVQTPEYIKQERLKAIDSELQQADEAYQTVLNTPVKYTNGLSYKPSYVNDYALLVATDIFPIAIWDATELNEVQMTKNELVALGLFLKQVAEPAFQARKLARKALLEEKTTLLDE
ncbi:MAG: hypothetical protein PHV37_01710 [Candidatus Gastranaerophilales bacterium]|nr:hypothetical protein [Candidatus Gastranaerophilales bacterium]